VTRRLIGIGNPDRGDDAAGWEVASRVSTWAVRRCAAGSFGLIDGWDATDDVVIVDAMRSGALPGSVRTFDGSVDPLPVGTFTSTHSFGPAEIVELARSLHRMPRSLRVIGIEVGHTNHGAAMSPQVALSVARVAKELQDA
jgi:hydrogenase maturation protease